MPPRKSNNTPGLTKKVQHSQKNKEIKIKECKELWNVFKELRNRCTPTHTYSSSRRTEGSAAQLRSGGSWF